jgi:hypothetical protein
MPLEHPEQHATNDGWAKPLAGLADTKQTLFSVTLRGLRDTSLSCVKCAA